MAQRPDSGAGAQAGSNGSRKLSAYEKLYGSLANAVAQSRNGLRAPFSPTPAPRVAPPIPGSPRPDGGAGAQAGAQGSKRSLLGDIGNLFNINNVPFLNTAASAARHIPVGSNSQSADRYLYGNQTLGTNAAQIQANIARQAASRPFAAPIPDDHGQHRGGNQMYTPQSPQMAAVKLFQQNHGLAVDGVVGPKTIAAGYGRTAPARPQPGNNQRPMAPSGPRVIGNSSALPAVARSGNAAPAALQAGQQPQSQGNNDMAAQIAAMRNQYVQPQATSNSDIATRAKYATDVELNPQEQALQLNAKLGDQQYQHDSQLAADNTARTVDEQGQIYGALDRSLGAMPNKTAGYYDTARGQVDDNYSKLQSALGKGFGDAQAATQSEGARLGLEAASPVSTSRLTQDQAWLQGIAGVNQQAEQGTMQNQKLAAIQQLLGLQSQTRAGGATLQGNTLRESNLAQNEAAFKQGQDRQNLLGQSNIIEGTRAGKQYEATVSLQQLQAQLQRQAAQTQFDNRIAQEKADAQSTLASGHANYFNTQAQTESRKVDILSKEAQIKQMVANGQLSTEQGKLAIERANATTNARNAQTNEYKATHPAAAGPVKFSPGIRGASEFLSTPVAQGGAGADPATVEKLNTIIGHTINKIGLDDKGSGTSRFTAALQEARGYIEKATEGQPNFQAIRNWMDQAIATAYGH